MQVDQKIKPERLAVAGRDDRAGALDSYKPRKMTMADNVSLTIKLLVALGLLGAALWAIDAWAVS